MMNNKLETHILNLSCRDRVGIVAKICSILAESNCNIVESKNENIFHDINSINVKLNEKKIIKKDRLHKIISAILNSKYPTVVVNINEHNLALMLCIYDFVYSVNKSKRLKIFNFFGSDNAAGFINACVTKTGFPNAVIFTEKGPEYEPFQIKSSILKLNILMPEKDLFINWKMSLTPKKKEKLLVRNS